MLNFIKFEMADMHFAYGLANGDSHEARHIYAERSLQCNLPSSKTFAKISPLSWRKEFFRKEYC